MQEGQKGKRGCDGTCSGHWSIGYLETSKQPEVPKDPDELYTIKRSWSSVTSFVTSWVCHCCFCITFYGPKGICPNIKTMAAFAETFMSHRMLAREEDILVVANFGFRNLAFHLGIRSNNIYHLYILMWDDNIYHLYTYMISYYMVYCSPIHIWITDNYSREMPTNIAGICPQPTCLFHSFVQFLSTNNFKIRTLPCMIHTRYH